MAWRQQELSLEQEEGWRQMAWRQQELPLEHERGWSQGMIDGMECVEGDHIVVPVDIAQDQKVTTSGHQEGQKMTIHLKSQGSIPM
jgi:hypothetical protein